MRRAETLSPTGRLDADYIRPLDRGNTRTIDRTGGTVLHTSRTNPSKMRAQRLPAHMTPDEAARYQVDDDVYDLTPLVLNNIDYLGLDYLITIGGDDTLSYSKVLDRLGVPLIAIPKTMDNDVQGTEYCIGFSSAVTRAKELINRQRTSLGSHERIGVFRIFGRESGFTALFTAYVTSARCVIPEAPFDLDQLIEVLRRGQAPQPVALRVRDRLGGRDVGGRHARPSSARRTHMGIGARSTSVSRCPSRSRAAPGKRPSTPS